jgi:hypothetical protein
MEDAPRVPKRHLLAKEPKLLICREMRRRRDDALSQLPVWHCQSDGTLPVLWHMNGIACGTPIVPNKGKLEISLLQLSEDAKSAEVSGSNTVSEPKAR